MTPGQRIKKRRKELNIGQNDIAEALNIKQTQISKYETDKSILPSDKLLTLCELLNLTPNYILLGKEELVKLTEDEKNLLELFNSVNEENQKELLGAMKMYIKENFNTQEEENMNQIS